MSGRFIARGLFVNQTKASCSIFESGIMMYNALLNSVNFQLDYIEISAEKRSLPVQYDFYLFNYHYATMAWLDIKSLKKLPGAKITLVLEVSPNDPFVLCPPEAFDAYCTLDPTIAHPDKRVYAFPRPLEVPREIPPYRERDLPVIGSFGFATPGKGFELVVDAVSREFDRAVVRINIPFGTYADDAFWHLHRQSYADYIADLCRRTAKHGVEVYVTRDFMSKDNLIKWCAENTLNCFLYNRKQPGLSATTDQAISSGRPLLVSANETFRHIHPYIKPYPFQSLKEAIAQTTPHVLEMQNDWAHPKIVAKFETVLNDLGIFDDNANNSPNSNVSLSNSIDLEVDTGKNKSKYWLRSKSEIKKGLKYFYDLYQEAIHPRLKLVSPSFIGKAKENTVLFVSHDKKQCGIHQYGLNLYEALQKSQRYSFAYAECSNEQELRNAAICTNPSLIIYNYYPTTMPWLNPGITRFFKIPQLGMMHEVTQQDADGVCRELFDYHLCPDPTLIENSPLVFKTKRLIPSYVNTTNLPEIVTVGSFGFGFSDKGFERLVEQVQKEFDQATIVIRMPFNDVVDQSGKHHAIDTAKRCRKLVSKPGIKLIIDHGFLTKGGLLDFLASNTINAFFYDTYKERGISSVIDYALAVQRPIAITRSGMFRHISSAKPSICIEESSLKEIIKNGIAPLVTYRNEWAESAFIMDYEGILDKLLAKDRMGSETKCVSYNRILDNAARKQYKPAIDLLFELVPDMLRRKIYEANIQQAFVIDTIRKFAKIDSKILCIGSFEDTASEALKKLGYILEDIDPVINYDLNTFFHLPKTKKHNYDIIFSTSVLEHVPNDGLFVYQISELLADNGLAILTCDFKDNYVKGDPLPETNLRFYTENSLMEQILPRLVNCQLVDEPSWQNAKHDFFYAGCFQYTFASLVFRKIQK